MGQFNPPAATLAGDVFLVARDGSCQLEPHCPCEVVRHNVQYLRATGQIVQKMRRDMLRKMLVDPALDKEHGWHEHVIRLEQIKDGLNKLSAASFFAGRELLGFRAAFQTRDELELCRRVAVALRPFAGTLARALWTLDRSSEQFADVWERCVLCAFDNHARGRFVLPELYKQGLLSGSSAEEQAKWYATAADELSKPEEGMLNVFDVRDVVIYRLLSGAASRVMTPASPCPSFGTRLRSSSSCPRRNNDATDGTLRTKILDDLLLTHGRRHRLGGEVRSRSSCCPFAKRTNSQ